MAIFSYQRSLPTAFLRLKGLKRASEMFSDGSVMEMLLSRMFCERFMVLESVSPMSAKVRL